MAEGLAAIHARGMAHGFFSAEKVLLTATPRAPHGFRAFVADYGLAPPAGGPPITQVRCGRGAKLLHSSRLWFCQIWACGGPASSNQS